MIDAATLLAGPLIATVLGDFGADVVKVEHPRGDPMRGHGPAKNGHPLWWKVASRNKRCVTLDLGKPAGAKLFMRLVEQADVLIENFRPGTMEGWGIGWESLHAVNPRLIMVRVTGFGQEGPYSQRPGFGSLSEAMCGWAYLNGQPEGPPTLPPFGLADGISSMVGVWATAFALYHRDVHGGDAQVVDLTLYEPIMSMLGQHFIAYDQLGIIPERTGNRSPNNAPRNVYKTRDGRWVAVSTSADSIARRVMSLVGNEEVTREAWFDTARGRAGHADELDASVSHWIAQHDLTEVLEQFTSAQAAVAPINDISQVMSDPHYLHRSTFVNVNDHDLGTVRMQNVATRLVATPGSIRWTGPALGFHNYEVFVERLGLSTDELESLRSEGII